MKQGFALIVIMAILLGAVYLFARGIQKAARAPASTPEVPGGRGVRTSPVPQGPEPETFILSGPQEGERIEEKEVTFRFGGMLPGGGELDFETKLEGADERWVTVTRDSRTITLPGGAKTYTFLVRGKSPSGKVDSTPASRSFFSNLSPYLGKVTISSLRAASSPEKITIRNSSRDKTPISISGWRIRSEKEESIIPQGVELFYYGALNPRGAITLGQGESVVVYTPAGSPGDNVKLNRCMGYLNTYGISPKFTESCPKPIRFDLRGFSLKCQDFITSLRACQIPNPNEPKLWDEPECRQWMVENLNYNACVRNHQKDIDFWSREWWAWLGVNRFIYGKSMDSIRLYDGEGHLVDRRDY